MPGVAVDGNDVLAVWTAMREAVDRARRGDGPTLIEAKTYRTVGHHEGDPVIGTYRTQEEVDAWAKRDPVEMFRKKLLEEYRTASRGELEAIDERIEAAVAGGARIRAELAGARSGDGAAHVYRRSDQPAGGADAGGRPGGPMTRAGSTRCATASPRRCGANPAILYFGEGTGERGGSFAHTKGLWQEFGAAAHGRHADLRAGLHRAPRSGASATGARTVADLMFADFIFETAGQIVLQAAKLRYMSNGQMNAPMVVRVGAGALRSAGPHHSGTYHPIFAHMPGLIVCMPSTPADAKGLMKTALRAGDPVHHARDEGALRLQGRGAGGRAFRAVRRRADRARGRRDSPSSSAGQMVHRALEAAETLAGEGIECEVIDLRTIMPLDVETIVEERRARRTACSSSTRAGRCAAIGAELAPGDERARLRRARRAGRAAAHRRRPRIRFAPVAGAGDAGRRRPDRRRRARR